MEGKVTYEIYSQYSNSESDDVDIWYCRCIVEHPMFAFDNAHGPFSNPHEALMNVYEEYKNVLLDVEYYPQHLLNR